MNVTIKLPPPPLRKLTDPQERIDRIKYSRHPDAGAEEAQAERELAALVEARRYAAECDRAVLEQARTQVSAARSTVAFAVKARIEAACQTLSRADVQTIALRLVATGAVSADNATDLERDIVRILKDGGDVRDVGHVLALRDRAHAVLRPTVSPVLTPLTLRDRISHGLALTAADVGILDGSAVRAASGSVCLFAKRELVAKADDAGPTWNQIATRGTFAGHGAGVFSLDDATFNEIIDNYRNVDGGEVAFDFEHASEQDASAGTIPTAGAPACGWIRELRLTSSGLFALVDFLEPARSYIRERKYRFVSPAIRFGAKHPVTGKPIGARLTSTALTNQPFLRGLQPLAASGRAA